MSAEEAMERVRAALFEHECQPRGGNRLLRARCPTHGSRGPTLQISPGHTWVQITCHAGCETSDIIAMLGLTWDDLLVEPRERRPWTPPKREPSRLERAYRIAVMANTQPRGGYCPPPAERIRRAEDGSRAEAELHYWRTMARYAALACDRVYVNQAQAEQRAWAQRRGPRPTHEQFTVLVMWAEDQSRGP